VRKGNHDIEADRDCDSVVLSSLDAAPRKESKVKKQVMISLCVVAALLGAAGLAGAVPRQSDGGTLLQAGAPTIVSYQGQVSLDGRPFDGTGYFKFAVVDSGGTTSYWSNDGTSAGGSEPTNAVWLTVAGGLFNVLLGDTSLTNMTQAMSATVFSDSDRHLRVWFSSDSVTFQLLSPDRRIGAVPYALQAEEAGDANTLGGRLPGNASGRIPINNGTVSLNLNADLLDGRHASDLEMPSGAMVLGLPNDSGLIAYGYDDLGPSNVMMAEWLSTSTTNAPSARSEHTAVWTGSEMLVWGGSGSSPTYKADGGRHDAYTDAWMAITTTNAPSGRCFHTAVWTGTEMLVWGGQGSSPTHKADGGRYDPSADTWMPITTTNAPSGRYGHTAVWTGSEMLVWGGYDGGFLNSGGRYDPSADTWTPISTTNAPSPRDYHTAVWTGSEMLIWGGWGSGGNGPTYFNTGGRYNPSTDTWTAMTTTGAPPGHSVHSAVWTGSEMLVWGGEGSGGYSNDGGQYDPATDTWTAITTIHAPSARSAHTAVWSGSEMLVWGGGAISPTYKNDGGSYDPRSNTWTAITTTNAPAGRRYHSAVWTGGEMIIWGGWDGGDLNSGGRYGYSRVLHLYGKP
jgi:hypothetical protein